MDRHAGQIVVTDRATIVVGVEAGIAAQFVHRSIMWAVGRERIARGWRRPDSGKTLIMGGLLASPPTPPSEAEASLCKHDINRSKLGFLLTVHPSQQERRMPTDRRSQQASDNLINGSAADRARYLTMLGRWARGELTLLNFDGEDDRSVGGNKK